MQGKQVEQHLNVQPHFHRREVKCLLAGLIVHHPQVQLPIPNPAVHPVHLTADPQHSIWLRNYHGWQGSIFSERELKGQRHKIRVPQLLRHLVHHRVGHIAQAGKEIAEAGVPRLEVVELLLHISVDIGSDQGMELLLSHLGKAA